MKLAPIIIFLLGATTLAWGQGSNILQSRKPVYHYSIKQWTTDKGMPSNTINQVFQSEDGYLWITTFNGLLRFDGADIEQYNVDNLDILNSNGFYSIFESDGITYFTTQASGVVTREGYQMSTLANSRSSTPGVRSFFQQSDGRKWLGTNNNGLFEVVGDSVIKHSHPEIGRSTVYAITENAEGELIIGTAEEGLFVISGYDVKRYDSRQGLPGDFIKTLEWINGVLFIGTTKGVALFDGDQILPYGYLQGVDINDIELGSYGDIWFATELGLGRVNDDDFEFFTEAEGLPSRQISSLTFDKEQNLWLSTKKSGLLQLAFRNFTSITTDEGLSLNRVNVIHKLRDGSFWIGTDNGAIDVMRGNEISRLPLDIPLDNISIKDILEDSRGDKWIASYAGLISVKGGNIKLLTPEHGMPDVQARVLHEDTKGNIWVGFKNNGLARINNQGIHSLNKSTGLGSDYILSIDQYNDDQIIVGTHSGGINFIEGDAVVKIAYPLDLDAGVLVFNTYVESEDRIWLATNVGLFLYDVREDSFKQISEADGLIAETIFDVEEDSQGYLWMSSNVGVVRLSKRSALDFIENKTSRLLVYLYDDNDGLLSKECTAAAQIYSGEDGTIWIPTGGGIATVNPESLTTNSYLPPVVVERFCVDDICNPVTNDMVMVSAGTKRFVIEFSALSLTAPEKVQFQYMLEGFDSDWIQRANQRRVVYTSLKPGKYTFKVRASNNDGRWNMQGASFDFRIRPYIYQTPWFYIALVLIAGAVVFFRLNSIRRHNDQLQKLNTELDSFVYSTSHDLRAPLMSILGLVNIAKLDKDPKRLEGYLDNIESSVKKLDSFISDIIDYSRNSRMDVVTEQVNTTDVILDVFGSLSYLDPEQQVKQQVNVDDDAKQITSDGRRLNIILSNIVSNSYRYHNPNGKSKFIEISAATKGPNIEIKVTDNGQGIKKEQQSRIFEMFYRATESSSGSGLGLYIVKETVEKLGGTVEVESEFTKGSTFTVLLPN